MIRVTNITQGWRGIHIANGEVVMLNPGECRELDVPEAEVSGASEEWFSFEKTGEGNDTPLDIASAIDLLDPANDDHWTNAGLPSVDAVSEIVGAKVTRADINAAAPEFMRPAA